MTQPVASPRPDDYEAMLVAQGAFPAAWRHDRQEMTASDKLERRLEEAETKFRKLEKWKQDLLEARDPDQRTQPRGGSTGAGDQFTANRDPDGFLRWAKIPRAAAEQAHEPPAASTRREILSQAAQRLPWAFLALVFWCQTILLTSLGRQWVEQYPRWSVPIGLGAAGVAGAMGLILVVWPCPALDYLAAEARGGDPERAHRAWLALVGTVGVSRASALVNGPQRGRWQVRAEDRP